MSRDAVRYHFLVSGRVQGVGFRFFVIDEAERAGLKGWVRNLPDGRVEAEAEGSELALEEFAKRLEIGPRTAQVTSVGVERLDTTVSYTDFQIR